MLVDLLTLWDSDHPATSSGLISAHDAMCCKLTSQHYLPNPRSSTTQSPRTTITTIIRITIVRSIWCTPRDLVNTIKHHHRHPNLSLILMQEGLPPVLRRKKKKSTHIHPIYSRDQCSHKKHSCSLLLQTLPPSSLPAGSWQTNSNHSLLLLLLRLLRHRLAAVANT